MTETAVAKTVSAALALAGAALLYGWVIGAGPDGDLAERMPGTDRPAQGTDEPGGKLAGKLTRGDGVPGEDVGAWPHFRGPNRDGVSAQNVPLLKTWPKDGPKALWTVDVGEGYAGPAVLAGRVYLLDYDAKERADALRCLSLADGRELWRFSYPVNVKRNHGMSRTVPAVTKEYVVAMGPKCHVSCVDAQTGEQRWLIDLVKEYKTTVPPWYAGQCVLIDGDKAVIAPGGEALVIAVELATGKVLWKTPNPKRWGMTHSSLVPCEFAGRKMYVYCGSGGVAGIAADDGRILWDTDAWKISIAAVPTPVIVGEGRIFLSGGYNAGSLMLQLVAPASLPAGTEAGSTVSRTEFRLAAQVFGATQQTPILFENRIFGVRPDGQLVCLDLQGKVQWASGAANKFGIGPFLIAERRVFVLSDDGVLTMAEAGTTGYAQLARAKVLDGPECWGPLALVGGRLLVRDLTRLKCLDLRE